MLFSNKDRPLKLATLFGYFHHPWKQVRTTQVHPIQTEPTPPLTRILISRPDRLGDVILSTPVFQAVREHFSAAHITLLVQAQMLPIIQGLTSVDQFLIFDPHGTHRGVKGFFRLCKEIQQKKLNIAICLQSHWKIATALFVVGVQRRIGPWSKPYSYLFYNQGVRQHRSQVEMHETDYNLQLLKTLDIRIPTRTIPTQIALNETLRDRTQSWLRTQGWDPSRPLILIHPGMSGSALNWPEDHYVELIRALVQEGRQVLITGGPTETALLDRIRAKLGHSAESVFEYRAFYPHDGIDFFAGLCEAAQVLIAPSTGPLHLAVALGKRVVTFYSPIRVQSAIRWGPYLSDDSQASILVPEVYCGQDFRCLGNLCHYFPCMKSLTVQQALKQTHLQLEEALKTFPSPSSGGYCDLSKA